MATTSLWRIKGQLKRVIDYDLDKEKTTIEVKGTDNNKYTQSDYEALSDVIEYAKREDATVDHDDEGGPTTRLISGINCSPRTARDEMQAVKEQFGKEGGTIAYHGYQAFKPGEGTPELIHQIGVELAKRLWGDRYQVLVCTHSDKHHLHNHFCINTVSFIDGRKFFRSNDDYKQMRDVSDELCRKYGLSVTVPEHKSAPKKDPAKVSWRKIIRADVDDAIIQAWNEQDFYKILQAKGYEIKDNGKDVSVKGIGQERFIRLSYRNFGTGYDRESIKKRITDTSRRYSEEEREYMRDITYNRNHSRMYIRYKSNTPIEDYIKRHLCLHGLRTKYLHYCYLLGVYPKGKSTNRYEYIRPEYKGQLMQAQRLSNETILLAKNHIDTIDQLISFRDNTIAQLNAIITERDALHKKEKEESDPEELEKLKTRIEEINRQCNIYRREIRLCKGIAESNGLIGEKEETKETQKTQSTSEDHDTKALKDEKDTTIEGNGYHR